MSVLYRCQINLQQRAGGLLQGDLRPAVAAELQEVDAEKNQSDDDLTVQDR